MAHQPIDECIHFVKPFYDRRIAEQTELEREGYIRLPGCMDGSLTIDKPDLAQIQGRYSYIEVRDPLDGVDEVVYHAPLEGGEGQLVDELRKGFRGEIGTRLQVLPPSSNNPRNIQRMVDAQLQSTRGLDIAETGGYGKWSRADFSEKYPVNVPLPDYGRYQVNKDRIMNMNQPRGFLNSSERIDVNMGQALGASFAPAAAISTGFSPPTNQQSPLGGGIVTL